LNWNLVTELGQIFALRRLQLILAFLATSRSGPVTNRCRRRGATWASLPRLTSPPCLQTKHAVVVSGAWDAQRTSFSSASGQPVGDSLQVFHSGHMMSHKTQSTSTCRKNLRSALMCDFWLEFVWCKSPNFHKSQGGNAILTPERHFWKFAVLKTPKPRGAGLFLANGPTKNSLSTIDTLHRV
jgi:hypothetical protein